MSLTFDGTSVKNITIDGKKVEKVIYNGVSLFESARPIGILLTKRKTNNGAGTWQRIDGNFNHIQ